jgi:hypothetical protein
MRILCSGVSVTNIPRQIVNQSDETVYELSLIDIGLAEDGYVHNLMALIKKDD